MKITYLVMALCTALLPASEVQAQDKVAAAAAKEPAYQTVLQVPTAKTLMLSDGRFVRLAGIQAPNVSRALRPGQPYAEEARQTLKKLVEGQQVRIEPVRKTSDHKGRMIAQVYTRDGTWVQGALLRAGAAMVYTFVDTRTYTKEMLALETEARAAQRGLWEGPYYSVLHEGNAMQGLHRFAIIEGTVQAIAEVRKTIYINFGEDWRTDFTVVVPPKHRRQFDMRMLQTLPGKRVRVRGWIYRKNGPSVDISHPELIEILQSGQGTPQTQGAVSDVSAPPAPSASSAAASGE